MRYEGPDVSDGNSYDGRGFISGNYDPFDVQYAPDAMEALRRSRAQARARGHEWDIADAYSAVRRMLKRRYR